LVEEAKEAQEGTSTQGRPEGTSYAHILSEETKMNKKKLMMCMCNIMIV
jgi:hypothetical protein